MPTSVSDAISSSLLAKKDASLSVVTTSKENIKAVDKNPMTTLHSAGHGDGLNIGDVAFNGKGSDRIIRDEIVHWRSRHVSQLRKGNLTVSSPSKQRKSVRRLEKPLWKAVISSLVQILLLFGTLLYIWQAIWNWTVSHGRDAYSHYDSLDFNARILEIETSVKEIEKMFQIQLEVVDSRIGREVDIISAELTKQIENEGRFLEIKLKKLEAKSDDLGNALSQLKGMGFLSKEELQNFQRELKALSSDGAKNYLDYDKIGALAHEIVEKVIAKHAADGLGRIDYALFSGGARVVKHSDPYLVGKASSWLGFTKLKSSVHSSAQKVLQPSFGEPGQCFPLQGSSGFVIIRLRAGIILETVTIEHVSKSVAYDRSSAPKDCRVSGWFEGPKGDPSISLKSMLVLTEFTYDIEKSNAQTFAIPMTNSRVMNMVRLDFTSNHGSSALTCIYRFRVHGYKPTSNNKP